MDHRNLDKAMEIFACLITGETVGRENHRDLYEAYSSQAEVYDILDAVLKKSNLRLYEVIEQSRRGDTENVERKRQGDVKEPVQDRNSKTEEDEKNAAY